VLEAPSLILMSAPLPIVDGVGPSSQWLPAGPWQTIFEFLTARFPRVATDTWLARMERGELLDERGERVNSESRYRAGACIFYYREVQGEKRIPFVESVLYQDENILVVDKPHFLPVIPAGRFLQETLLVRLKKSFGLADLVPVHRLDRETAGVMLFSVNATTRGQYTSLFRKREVRKLYEALAPAHPGLIFPLTRRSRIVSGEPFFRMTETVGEPNSVTRIDLIENRDGVSRYQLHPVTGKKHQLRVHLSALGIPISNDRLYPETSRARGLGHEDDFENPLKLLARSISFRDPLTGQEQYFASNRELW
jgi:tRNA pseudouridine32 synthase/23S rRNA pseudouridine746 synthase